MSLLSRIARLWTGPAEARARVGQTPCDVVHRENKWRLLRYRPRPAGIVHTTPILMIPSLINRHYVLDLMPGRSLVAYLVAAGHDVFVIDWGTPADEDRYLSFDEICDRYIGRAVRRAAALAQREAVHLLGYCLGGTLATIYAAARPERVRSLVALAAPIDFRQAGILGAWTQSPHFDVDALVAATGLVPWPLMQASFHLLRPTLGMSKAVGVLDRLWDDAFLDGFFALETWGNDNVSFPGACYRRYIAELYRDNALIEGRFRLSGEPVDLGRMRCPVLAVTFAHDHIVPPASAAALVARVPGAEQLELTGGHVGAVVSRKASEALWPALRRWWTRHELPDQAVPPVRRSGMGAA